MGPLIRLVKCAAKYFSLIALALGTIFAQSSGFIGQCLVTSTPLQVHSDGLTERVGDIGLQCSGVPGAVFTGNLALFFPVNVTNRIDANHFTHDAAVSVDVGGGLIPSPVAGLIAGNNVAFNGIGFTIPASGSVALRVSGIRVAAGQFTAPPTPISALISSNLPVDQANVLVAYPQTSLLATLYDTGITCYGSPSPDTIDMADLFAAGTAFASTRLTEGFASSFEVRSANATGTRFLVKYSNFPANARLYVPDFVAGSDALAPTAGGDLGVAQNAGQYVPGSRTFLLALVSGADATGAGGMQVSAPTGAEAVTLNGASEVVLTGGAGFAVYEVVDANPSVQETAQFPTFIAIPRVTAATLARETVSLGPVSSLTTASADAPVPRFRAGAVASDCNALNDCAAPYFPKLMVDTTPLEIAAMEKGGLMTTQPAYIPIRNGGGGLMAWNVTFTYDTGSDWLIAYNPSGTGNASVRVWSDTKSLSAGTYHAEVHINGGSAGTQTIPLTLTVSAAPPPPPVVVIPTVTISKVVNAATFGATPLVAGSIGTVMGSHLKGNKVSVTFDGLPAAVLFTGENQINLQVPVGLAGKTSANMVVVVDDVSSAPFPVTLAAAWPSIFAHGVLNQDSTENGSAAAASSGSILQIFATGIPKNATVSVQIGGIKDLIPVYAGDAPGLSGLQQVNIAVPEGATSGDLLLCAAVAGQPYCSAPYPITVR